MLISAEGVEGEWQPWTLSQSNTSIHKVWIRSGRPCGGCDDTATHGLRFEDSDGSYYHPYDGYWDTHWKLLTGNCYDHFYKYWYNECLEYDFDGYWASATCTPGKVITGFVTQVEPDQGSGDDTGLNGVQFQCN